jgi:hypothetical protein
MGNADFTSGVSLLCELASEEFTKFGFEYTIGHKLRILEGSGPIGIDTTELPANLSLLTDVGVGGHYF